MCYYRHLHFVPCNHHYELEDIIRYCSYATALPRDGEDAYKSPPIRPQKMWDSSTPRSSLDGRELIKKRATVFSPQTSSESPRSASRERNAIDVARDDGPTRFEGGGKLVELKMDAERPRAVLELKNKLLPPTPPSSSPISAPTSNPFDSVTRRPVRMKVPMRPCGQQQYHPLTTFRVYMLCPSCTVVRKETESKIAVLKQELKSAKIRVEGLLFLEKARGKKEQLRSFPEYCDDIKLKESCWEEEAAAIEKEMRENEGVIEIVEWLAEDGEETW